MGRASTTTTPQSDAEEKILRFRPNRMIDYTGAGMAAMAAESSMKWGGKAGDAQSGRSVRSMINDALTRHSKITPLGASGIVSVERDDKGLGCGLVYPHQVSPDSRIQRLFGRAISTAFLHRVLLAVSVLENGDFTS